MPKGPRGEKRPADAIGLAVMIGKIATGEIAEGPFEGNAIKGHRGKAGGIARAKSLSPERKNEIAAKAANRRWNPEVE